MANSADPEQTAPKEQSVLGLHYLHSLLMSEQSWSLHAVNSNFHFIIILLMISIQYHTVNTFYPTIS